ncbi:MAG: hypothetical protein F6K17_21090 [Okeania sp. SIO3C4]|nr:hypothetical protein [Okeania sp. SIO3C4]
MTYIYECPIGFDCSDFPADVGGSGLEICKNSSWCRSLAAPIRLPYELNSGEKFLKILSWV